MNDAAGEGRPAVEVVVRWHSHTPAPAPPKDLDCVVSSGIMAKHRGRSGVGGFSQKAGEIGHEFGDGVRAEHLGWPMHEDNTVQKGLHQSGCLSIGQRDDGHVARGGVNRTKGLSVSPDILLHPATCQCTGMYLHSSALLQRQRNELLSVPSASYQKVYS
jgi:hypothetical protein